MDQPPQEKPNRLEYYGDEPAEAGDGIPFQSRLATIAMEIVAISVGLGMVVGLSEPGPMLRKLGACGVFMGGAVGGVIGLMALRRPPLGYVDRSLAITSAVLGLICMAAGVALFTGWRV